MSIRHFVITPGRSGSSILCAIMADAGADFGMPAPSEWDRTGGTLECPLMIEAVKTQESVLARSPTPPLLSLAKFDWKLRRAKAKRLLAKSLAQATYFKAVRLDLLAGPAIRLGYDVRPVISLRRYESLIPSMLRWRSHFGSFRGIEKAYIETYENALSLLYRLGGCWVDYDELMDHEETDWAARLSDATGLDPQALLDSRD